MSTSALRASGVTIGYGLGTTPETYTTIAEVVSWTGPEESEGIIDVSDLSSTSVAKIANGLLDGGRVTLELNALPANTQHTAFRTDMAAETLRAFKITLTDSGVMDITFSAYVTAYSISGRAGDKIACSVTLEISGAVTYTA